MRIDQVDRLARFLLGVIGDLLPECRSELDEEALLPLLMAELGGPLPEARGARTEVGSKAVDELAARVARALREGLRTAAARAGVSAPAEAAIPGVEALEALDSIHAGAPATADRREPGAGAPPGTTLLVPLGTDGRGQGSAAILATVRIGDGEEDRVAAQSVPSEAALPRPGRKRRRPAEIENLVGRTLGGYEVRRLLGHGGFGSVYEGRDRVLDCPVAIKVVHDRTRNPATFAALQEEARRLTKLEHPSIVDWKVCDRTEDGLCYFVMELIDGEDLESIIRRHAPLHPQRVAGLLLQVLDALRTAHSLPEGAILHLDLKPKNIFVVPPSGRNGRERVKIIDFGISQVVGRGPTSSRATSGDADPGSAGRIRRCESCTPEYASPEQGAHVLGAGPLLPLDGRSDLYSIGVVAYRMLSGCLPFRPPAQRMDYLKLHAEAQPLPITAYGVRVPKALWRFVERCLQKDRDLRWANADEAWAAMARIVHPPLARRVALAAGALSLAAGAAAFWFWPEPTPRLDLVVQEDGRELSLASTPLFLGPERPAAVVRVSGWERDLRGAQCRLLADSERSEVELPGWTVAAEAERHVTIRAPRSGEAHRGLAYLEVSDEAERRRSLPFELGFIAPQDLAIAAVGVPGADGRAVDPHGQRLEVLVQGSADLVASVRLLAEGEAYVGRPSDRLAPAGAALYEVDLERLAEAPLPGGAELAVVLTDRAGGERRRPFDLALHAAPLRVESLFLDASLSGDGYLLQPGRAHTLSVVTNGDAEASWRLLDHDGAVLHAGASRSGRSSSFVLPDAATLRSGRSFSGWIELVADDSAFVQRSSPERGRVSKRIPIVFLDEHPAVVLRLGSGEDAGAVLSPDEPRHSATRAMVLNVARANAVPAEVAVRVLLEGRECLLETRLDLRDPSRIEQAVPLRVPGDGWYEILATSRPGGVAPSDAAEGGSIARASIVVDTSPPAIDLCIGAQGDVLGPRSGRSLSLVTRVRDLPEHPFGPSPIQLLWTVRGGAPFETVVAHGSLERVPGGEGILVEVDLGAGEGAVTALPADGDYTVELVATDPAGNESGASSVPFHVAARPPQVELAHPPPRVDWSPGESGGYALEVLAADPNGVDSVRGTVRLTATEEGAIDVTLEPAADADAGVWRGRVAIPPGWHGAEVQVGVEAVDRFGNPAWEPFTRRVADLAFVMPEVIQGAPSGRASGRMRLVRSLREVGYVFGGRHDAVEQELFQAAGLPPFNQRSIDRCWGVAFDPGAIQDFYLDEGEVTCGQFLQFLRDPAGWSQIANWPGTAAGGGERRAELERLCASRPPDLPVTEVTWEEAFAFSRWAGKRLPSLVEWEFAVRGGQQYRPYAAYLPGGGTRPPEARQDLELPLTLGMGGDRTPDTGIWNLSGNVAEWTATPSAFTEDWSVPRRFAEHVSEMRALFLAPWGHARWDSADAYWIAGGASADRPAEFTSLDRRPRDWHGPSAGFRCALSAVAVLEELGRPDPAFREALE